MPRWGDFLENIKGASGGFADYTRQEKAKTDAFQALIFKAAIEQKFKDMAMQSLFDKYKEMGFGTSARQPEGSVMPGTEPAIEPVESDYTLMPTGDPDKPFKFELSPQEQLRKQFKEKEQIKEIEVESALSKTRKEAERNFEIAKNKLKTTAGAFKAMVAQEGAGRIGGFRRIWTGTTGENPYVKAFEGELVEAAASLAKLAAPSARVGQEIIQQFKKTLPTKFSNTGEFINQIRFSLHNAFSTALAGSGQEYTQDVRDKIDSMVEEIINTPALSLEDLHNINKQDKQDKQLDKETAMKILQEVNGDKIKAREIARQRGYIF